MGPENSQENSTEKTEKKIKMSTVGDKSPEEQDAEALMHKANKLVSNLISCAGELDEIKKVDITSELIKERRDMKQEAWEQLNTFMFDNAKVLQTFETNPHKEHEMFQRTSDPLPKTDEVDIDSLKISSSNSPETFNFTIYYNESDGVGHCTDVEINKKTGAMVHRTSMMTD